MNPIEILNHDIQNRYLNAITEITSPLQLDGVWSLEINLREKHLIVEWSKNTGFGVSTVSDENFGEGPDEVFESLHETQRRIDHLLTTSERTSPILPVLLSRLRERRGVTQQELASRLGVRQATVSGVEKRHDVQLSTLRRIVEALGGILQVFAIFSDCHYQIRVESPLSNTCSLGDQSVVTPRQIRGRQTVRKEVDCPGLREAGVLPQALLLSEAIRNNGFLIQVP